MSAVGDNLERSAAPSGTGSVSSLLPREHRGILVAFLVIAALNLLGESVAPPALAILAKTLLVPTLLLWVLAVRRSSSPRLLVAGLVLAWLGDIALMLSGDTAFLVGLVLFLGMQICYSLGFARLGAVASLRARPWIPAAGALLWIALNIVVGPLLGALRAPMAVYSLALVTMAVLACGVSVRVGRPAVGVGGAVFLVSDLLIGLGAAGVDLAAHDVAVMATYALGQLLIATGWLAAENATSRRESWTESALEGR